MLKKVISGLVVFVLVIGLYSEGIGGESWWSKWWSKKETKELKKQGTEGQKAKSNKRLKPKIQRQVGTPTVQQLLDKVKANYSKIQDLKADMVATIERPGGWGYPIMASTITQEGKYYFKAPDKLKFEHPTEEKQTIIFKQQTKYIKDYEKNEVISYRMPWYLILDPIHLPFYFRLNEIIEKFDTKVIDNPQTDIWVIEAVPKASNPDDEYNYPNPNGKLWFYLNYEKGIITQIEGYSIPENDLLTFRAKIRDFVSLNDTWIPTKFTHTQFRTNVKEEITLSNIQLNTGIPDSEFEF